MFAIITSGVVGTYQPPRQGGKGLCECWRICGWPSFSVHLSQCGIFFNTSSFSPSWKITQTEWYGTLLPYILSLLQHFVSVFFIIQPIPQMSEPFSSTPKSSQRILAPHTSTPLPLHRKSGKTTKKVPSHTFWRDNIIHSVYFTLWNVSLRPTFLQFIFYYNIH